MRLHFKTKNLQRGVTLLISVLVTGLLLAIGTAILNITLKQFQLAAVSRDSAVAFYAADAGLECGKYWDRSPVDGGAFSIDGGGWTRPLCMGVETALRNSDRRANEPQILGDMTWGPIGELCTKVQVTKFYDNSSDVDMTPERRCPQGFSCTIIESRGYNRACTDLDSPRTVERAIRAIYGGCRIGVNCP